MKHWNTYTDRATLIADVAAGKRVDLNGNERLLAWLWPISAKAEGHKPQAMNQNMKAQNFGSFADEWAAILRFLSNGEAETTEIRRACNFTKHQCECRLRAMRRAGVVERIGFKMVSGTSGGRRVGVWKATEKATEWLTKYEAQA